MELNNALINFGFLLVILVGVNGWLNSGATTYTLPGINYNGDLNVSAYTTSYEAQAGTDSETTAEKGILTQTGTGSDWYTGVSIWLKNMAAVPTWSKSFMSFNNNIATMLKIPLQMSVIVGTIITFMFLLAIFAAFLRWKA